VRFTVLLTARPFVIFKMHESTFANLHQQRLSNGIRKSSKLCWDSNVIRNRDRSLQKLLSFHSSFGSF